MITTQDALSPPEVPRSHRGRWIIGGLVAVLIIFVVWHILAQRKPTRATPAQVVKVAKAVLGDMPETLSELGTVAPVATVTVLPQLSGYLTEVGYKEGQDVKKGQFLAQIDPRQYEIDLRQAQAALERRGVVVKGTINPLARFVRDQQKIIATLCTRLRISPQSRVSKERAATNADRPRNAFDYDQSDDLATLMRLRKNHAQ